MTQIRPKKMVGLALFAKSFPNDHPYGKMKETFAFLSRNKWGKFLPDTIERKKRSNQIKPILLRTFVYLARLTICMYATQKMPF